MVKGEDGLPESVTSLRGGPVLFTQISKSLSPAWPEDCCLVLTVEVC